MIPVAFYAMTDIVSMGRNPEMADYDNPTGEIYGFSSYTVAVSQSGERRRKYVSSSLSERECLEPAYRVAEALNARLGLGKLPVAFSSWEHYHSEYGSAAYIENCEEAELISLERSMEETQI
jgi:hypothetical protein